LSIQCGKFAAEARIAAAVISGLPDAPSSPLQVGVWARAETGIAPVRSPSPADSGQEHLTGVSH
jgi:hypothetical protein